MSKRRVTGFSRSEWTLSRRAILRGIGTAVACPFLESALGRGSRTTEGEPSPSRLVYLYSPNGMHMPDWTPTEEGSSYELPWILEPLAKVRDQLTVLSGLAHDKARANGDGPGDHARAAAVFLTGVQPLKTDGEVRLAVSVDQIASEQVGDRTRFRSIQLGLDRARNSGQCDSGYACAYSGNISWQSATTPTAKEIHPRIVFDRLFRGGQDALGGAAEAERRARRKSVLDYVRTDADRMRRRLGEGDRRKLDEYFSGLRELERRIERVEDARVEAVPDSARPSRIPRDFAEHARLMLELLALALAADCTRIATFMFSNEGSNRSYPSQGVSEGHHSLSHHGDDAEKIDKIRRINRFHVQLVAEFLERLDQTAEGQESLLDNTTVVYGSCIADGNRHGHHDLPVILAGGAGRVIPLARHLRFPRDTPMNNLHLSLLEGLGVRVESLGDATGPLM